jgi:hypothetical protein
MKTFNKVMLAWGGALAFGAVAVAVASKPSPELVWIKYRNEWVDLRAFECRTNPYPSFVKRVCFQKDVTDQSLMEGANYSNQYMVILLKETWYDHCGVDPGTKSEIWTTEHKGTYYARNIRRKFDCVDMPDEPEFIWK